jgi:hypothetical protein
MLDPAGIGRAPQPPAFPGSQPRAKLLDGARQARRAKGAAAYDRSPRLGTRSNADSPDLSMRTAGATITPGW